MTLSQCTFASWKLRTFCTLVACLAARAVVITAEVPEGDSQSGDTQLPAAGRPRVVWQTDLHPQVAKEVRDELIIEADEHSDAGKSDTRAAPMQEVSAFRGNARVRLKDGSVAVSADQAAVRVQYSKNSRTSIDMVTVTLSGNVRGHSDGVDVIGQELKLLLRPLQGDDASARYGVKWKLEGAGQIKGRNFTAKGDCVALVSQEGDSSNSIRAKVVLNGNAHVTRGKSGRINGSRIEFTIDHGEFRLGG